MSKKESTFINMVFTLMVITLGASTALGLVYKVTKEPIEEAKLKKKLAAINEVVPEFNNNPSEEAFSIKLKKDSLVFYPAKKDDMFTGMAVETFSNKGFSGMIKLMVGFLPDGTINNVAVMEHKETPGLGDKMEKEKHDFSYQVNGKNPKDYKLKVTKDGGDVDAITAATISSRAFCDAIEQAYKTYTELDGYTGATAKSSNGDN